MTSNENALNSNDGESKPNADSDSNETFEEAKSRAFAMLARSDSSIRSRFELDFQALEEAKKQLESAIDKRETAWNALPQEIQKTLAETLKTNQPDSISEFVKSCSTGTPLQTIFAAVRAQNAATQVQELFYQERSKCLAPLIDQIMSTCDGYTKFKASFPTEEFESDAKILLDLSLCDSLDEAVKKARARWETERPCVLTYGQWKRREKSQDSISSFKREWFREYKQSPDWKTYASSPSTIIGILLVSTLGVAAFWWTVLKWNLVYFLRFESLFPYKSDAYRFLYFMTPVVWLALAYLYRNVVLLRLDFHSRFKKFSNFRKNEDKAQDE